MDAELAMVQVKSHRARQRLERALGYLPQGFFSFERRGEWREIPVQRLGELLQILGIAKGKPAPDLQKYIF